MEIFARNADSVPSAAVISLYRRPSQQTGQHWLVGGIEMGSNVGPVLLGPLELIFILCSLILYIQTVLNFKLLHYGRLCISENYNCFSDPLSPRNKKILNSL